MIKKEKKSTLIAILPPLTTPPLVKDETIDGLLVRGTRSLSNVYQRCNLSMVKPKNFNETTINLDVL